VHAEFDALILILVVAVGPSVKSPTFATTDYQDVTPSKMRYHRLIETLNVWCMKVILEVLV